MMQPTIGRIVHYQLTGEPGVVRPAIVLEVHSGERLDLHVLLKPSDSRDASYAPLVEYSPTRQPGTWDWPARNIPDLAQTHSFPLPAATTALLDTVAGRVAASVAHAGSHLLGNTNIIPLPIQGDIETHK